jgi:hypothetical protein
MTISSKKIEITMIYDDNGESYFICHLASKTM